MTVDDGEMNDMYAALTDTTVNIGSTVSVGTLRHAESRVGWMENGWLGPLIARPLAGSQDLRDKERFSKGTCIFKVTPQRYRYQRMYKAGCTGEKDKETQGSGTDRECH